MNNPGTINALINVAQRPVFKGEPVSKWRKVASCGAGQDEAKCWCEPGRDGKCWQFSTRTDDVTPVFLGVRRPWHVGILYRKSAAYAGRLIEGLGGAEAMIAGNQPYQIDDESDYTVPVHGEARGLESVLVELRQDLVAGPRGQAEWADRLTPLLMRG